MDQLNFTYITLSGFVAVEQYRYVYFMLISAFYILILLSNCTIICLVVIKPNLHEPMYVFIAALLVNSVLFSSAIYPKLLLDVLSDEQVISHPLCHLQFFFYYFLGCAEFMLLLAMAYDRYVSICRPLQYAAVMTRRSISVVLVFAWIIPAGLMAGSAAISASMRMCSSTLNGLFCNNSLYRLQCTSSMLQSVYGGMALLNTAFLPLLFIVFTYAKILLISYRSSREVRTKAAQTCLPHLLVLVNYSALAGFDVILARVESDVPATARLVMNLQLVLYHPLFNPIIYGLKMKEISKHLRRLLGQITSLSVKSCC
ncbi:uncharacterized protein V6R79_000098 [Siganus canaliculatus]